MSKKTTDKQEQVMDHGSMKMDHEMKMDHGSMKMDHDMMMHGGQMMHMGNLKQKFWVSLILSLPVLFLAPVMGLDRALISWEGGASKGLVILLFDALLYFYGGAPFLKGAVAEVKDKKPAMMTLITLGISVSFFYSLYAILINNFGHPQTAVMDFSFELATLILIMLLGHWIEMNAVMGAGNALDKIAALLPSTAHLVTKDGQITDVKLTELRTGQLVQVRAGESLPTDGIVAAGSSAVNEALVTGEAAAVTKKVNDQVIGGSINENGTLTVKITKTGQNGYLSQVMEMVQQAQQAKSKAETRADTVAGYLFYAAVIVGLIAFFVWLPQGLATALSRMVTVLVIACPHALGVAIPLVVARSTSIGAKNGLLLRNRQALEATKSLSHIFFDKTGTLTAGKFKLNALVPANGYSKQQLLGNLAALEANSSHPLAQAILSAAKAQKLQLPAAQQVKTLPGVGLSGQINGQQYLIVNLGYLMKKRLKFDRQQVETWSSRGNTISFLLDDQQQILGMMAAGDQLKAGAQKLITKLKSQGITPVMLTGDNQAAAKYVADQLGITDYHAGLLPADKQQIIEKYQHDGKHVMMVGDGVNDAPSLATADLGVAIGAGTDVAIDSADVILVKSDPHDILSFLSLAKLTNRKMIQNLWWGAGYNLIALPLAAGVLAPIGIILDPAVGAIVMGLSTVIVALNAMSLNEKSL
ncbi:heavy metal translocating P-type ATPase [Liquorilactobacillus vini]|uniref:P-type Cu(+) transporter n=2 Tax=Liquorilactobacillus vini TaxID=238015 RepID=A0A0R2CLK6_9LACO|nr:heavy metal translocating P-type ATPase [Liquorilactobacillus vini]KRM89148.1 copper-exporting ATPase [Liquorilactobacillus vini DSM 20605]